MKHFIILFIFPLLLSSCNSKENKDEAKEKENSSKITKFSGAEYAFKDSSVEPRYHRSYSIIVDGSKIKFEISSYDDVLLENTYELKPEQAELINKVIPNLTGIENLKQNNESGSTSEKLVILSGKDVVAEAFWNEGENESIVAFRDAMKSLIPDFDEQMKKTAINGLVIFMSNITPEDLNIEDFNKLAEEHQFKVVFNSDISEDEITKTNELSNKLMELVTGENWKEDFKLKTEYDLESFKL
jgi:hypothetical protein